MRGERGEALTKLRVVVTTVELENHKTQWFPLETTGVTKVFTLIKPGLGLIGKKEEEHTEREGGRRKFLTKKFSHNHN